MANNNNTVWASLGQILLAVGTSYLSAKISNTNTGWVAGGYRDQLIGSAATVVLSTAAQQVAEMQQQTANNQTAASDQTSTTAQ